MPPAAEKSAEGATFARSAGGTDLSCLAYLLHGQRVSPLYQERRRKIIRNALRAPGIIPIMSVQTYSSARGAQSLKTGIIPDPL